MSLRLLVLITAALFVGSAKGHWGHLRQCASPCPTIPQCPTPHCPTPNCPKPSCPTPTCPTPQCPSIPSCPTPHCPTPNCPKPSCPTPTCPTPQCPSIPSCPTPNCPTPQCPPPVVNLTCPELHCPPPPPTSPMPSCPSSPVCPPPRLVILPSGYQNFPGIGIYKLYSDKKTWLEGNMTCSKDGGYLAVPNTKVEMDVLKSILQQYRGLAHIGFNGFFRTAEFVTSIGEPMDTFQRSLWGRKQPDRSPDKTGVDMNAHGKIYSVGNDKKHEFLCEIPLIARD